MSFFHSFCKQISASLKSIDIYGRKTYLTLNHKEKYKTALGGFFTLCIVSLFFLLFFNFGSDMIFFKNPSTSVSEIYAKTPEREDLSREKYFFMLGVQDSTGHYVDDSIYNIKVYNDERLPGGSFNTHFIDLEKCTENHLPSNPDLREYFLSASNSPLDRVLCPKNFDDIFLEGAYDAAKFSHIIIEVNICKNQTDNTSAPYCQSSEEIAKRTSGYFAFYGVDYLIDPQNFKSPGQAIGKDYFTPIAVGTTRVINRFIASSKVNSDDGFLISTKTEHQYPTHADNKETFLMDTSNSGTLVYFEIRKHHSNYVYERNYKKLQRVLAEIGGFTQIIYLFFWILNYPFAKKQYYEKIVNMIYNFESNKNNNYVSSRVDCLSKDLSFYGKNFQPPKSRDSFNLSKESKLSTISKEYFMKYLNKIKNRLPLKMTYWEYFKSFFFSNAKKLKQVNNYKKILTGKKAIEEKLDVGYLLKKIYEIDKIKMIIFNENQYNLFDYLPKPVILKNLKIDLGNKSSNMRSYESDDVFSKAKKLYLAYQNISKQQELSPIDKKLIELLDENVKNLLVVNIFLIL